MMVRVPPPAAPGRPELVRGLQERAARAFPAEDVAQAGGWWLRRAPGCAWWVASVLPHGDAGPGELARRVAAAEKFYAGHGTAARFQISPPACPAALDTLLAGRGYHRRSPMSLQVAVTAQVTGQTPVDPLPVRLDEHAASGWLDVWHAVHGRGGDWRSERDMLRRVEQPGAYACATSESDVIAVGRVVADHGWAGVFGMATCPQARGKGAARAVLAALAGWAAAHGAGRMYLQVEQGNRPAFRLYGQAGFREVCGYHYRTAD